MGSTQRLPSTPSTAACLLSLWGIRAQPPGPAGAAEIKILALPGQCIQGPASLVITNHCPDHSQGCTMALTVYLGLASQSLS